MLAGCSGSQPLTSAPGAVREGRAIANDVSHSPTMGGAYAGNLLYVSTEDAVVILTLPDGNVVGTLPADTSGGLCSDTNGNVFTVNDGSQQVVEYPHGSTTAIKTLSDYGNDPNGCAVDPATGNLAVVGGGYRLEDNVAIYPNADGPPTVYKANGGGYFLYCTYDSQGNLFTGVGDVENESIWELPKGGNSLTPFSLDKALGPDGGLQWDGKYLDVQNAPGPGDQNEPGPITIYQVKIAGSVGTVAHTISMRTARDARRDRQSGLGSQFWIQGGAIYTRVRWNRSEGVWQYPKGGLRIRTFPVRGNLVGVTVSVPPSR
jgi:hypothetical protein